MGTSFLKPACHLTIGSLDDSSLYVEAQYNPKDLQITQAIKWDEHKPLHRQKTDSMALEFGAMQPQTVKVELLFDGFETEGEIGDTDAFVMNQVEALKQLAAVIEPNSPDPDRRRPHYCVLVWGMSDQSLKPLPCIIENVTTTYQTFSGTGQVLRATVAVSLKEAHCLDYEKRHADAPTSPEWLGKVV